MAKFAMGGGEEATGGVGGGEPAGVRGAQVTEDNDDVMGQDSKGGGSACFPMQEGETDLSEISGRFRFQHKPFSIAIKSQSFLE